MKNHKVNRIKSVHVTFTTRKESTNNSDWIEIPQAKNAKYCAIPRP